MSDLTILRTFGRLIGTVDEEGDTSFEKIASLIVNAKAGDAIKIKEVKEGLRINSFFEATHFEKELQDQLHSTFCRVRTPHHHQNCGKVKSHKECKQEQNVTITDKDLPYLSNIVLRGKDSIFYIDRGCQGTDLKNVATHIVSRLYGNCSVYITSTQESPLYLTMLRDVEVIDVSGVFSDIVVDFSRIYSKMPKINFSVGSTKGQSIMRMREGQNVAVRTSEFNFSSAYTIETVYPSPKMIEKESSVIHNYLDRTLSAKTYFHPAFGTRPVTPSPKSTPKPKPKSKSSPKPKPKTSNDNDGLPKLSADLDIPYTGESLLMPCGYCMSRLPNALCDPCGHLMCQVCAKLKDKCPQCGMKVWKTYRCFFNLAGISRTSATTNSGIHKKTKRNREEESTQPVSVIEEEKEKEKEKTEEEPSPEKIQKTAVEEIALKNAIVLD